MPDSERTSSLCFRLSVFRLAGCPLLHPHPHAQGALQITRGQKRLLHSAAGKGQHGGPRTTPRMPTPRHHPPPPQPFPTCPPTHTTTIPHHRRARPSSHSPNHTRHSLTAPADSQHHHHPHQHTTSTHTTTHATPLTRPTHRPPTPTTPSPHRHQHHTRTRPATHRPLDHTLPTHMHTHTRPRARATPTHAATRIRFGVPARMQIKDDPLSSTRPCGLMDAALVFGTKDCTLESCQGPLISL